MVKRILEKLASTRTPCLKIIKIKIRKLLHSIFCGGRMRAVQGLEDSARFFFEERCRDSLWASC
jgi:hypothetical protein